MRAEHADPDAEAALCVDLLNEIAVGVDGIQTAVRDDRVREAGVELGYQFRTRVRVGVTAYYTTRDTTIETFGIEGLLAGLTVQYNPPQPSFR